MRIIIHNGLFLPALVAVFLVTLISCGSDGKNSTPTPESNPPCQADEDCSSNQGCLWDTYEEEGYCSPLCSSDGQCPYKIICPSLERDSERECEDIGDYKNNKGVCDLYSDAYSPETCQGGEGEGESEGESEGEGEGEDLCDHETCSGCDTMCESGFCMTCCYSCSSDLSSCQQDCY